MYENLWLLVNERSYVHSVYYEMQATYLHCLIRARVEIFSNNNKGPYPVVLGW